MSVAYSTTINNAVSGLASFLASPAAGEPAANIARARNLHKRLLIEQRRVAQTEHS